MARSWSVHVFQVRQPDLGDSGHDRPTRTPLMLALRHRQGRDLGAERTAWAMLHRLRSVLVRPGRDRLRAGGSGRDVHRGEESGLRGGRARGKKVLTGIAVEVLPTGLGRCRMRPLADASAVSLHAS